MQAPNAARQIFLHGISKMDMRLFLECSEKELHSLFRYVCVYGYYIYARIFQHITSYFRGIWKLCVYKAETLSPSRTLGSNKILNFSPTVLQLLADERFHVASFVVVQTGAVR